MPIAPFAEVPRSDVFPPRAFRPRRPAAAESTPSLVGCEVVGCEVVGCEAVGCEAVGVLPGAAGGAVAWRSGGMFVDSLEFRLDHNVGMQGISIPWVN